MSAWPYGDDLVIGQPLPAAPSITIDEGLASAYQGVVGDGTRLPLSTPLSVAVTGREARLVNPGLVLQVAIGQSTVATRLVIANLFYRDVALLRQVHLGDTLTTTVTPVALQLTRPGVRERRAKVALRIETVDQEGRNVCRFERVALLPCRDADSTVESGSVGVPEPDRSLEDFAELLPAGWAVSRFPRTGLPSSNPWTDPLSDSVSSALELVRLTQNLAAAHRDPARGQCGQRLVYGGHAIGLAQASLARACPGLVTVLGWRACDHVAPVFEADVLEFEVSVTDTFDADPDSIIAGFRVLVRARRATDDDEERPVVLDWTPVALVRRGDETQEHA